MNAQTSLTAVRAHPGRPVNFADTFDFYFGSTMAGGTSLVELGASAAQLMQHDVTDYITIRTDVILEYERTINDLRRELLRYKRLLNQVLAPAEPTDTLADAYPVTPLDIASVRVVNSILSARVPPSATFTDFDEGEL